MSGISTELFILGLLLVVNGFSPWRRSRSSRRAKARLKQLADEGDEGARAALELASQPTRFLSTVQIGVTLCASWREPWGINRCRTDGRVAGTLSQVAPWANSIAFGVVVGLVTFFSLISVNSFPKRIALSNPERIARFVAGPLQGVSRLFSPIILLLSAATDFLLKPFGLTRRRETPVTDEEVNIWSSRA